MSIDDVVNIILTLILLLNIYFDIKSIKVYEGLQKDLRWFKSEVVDKW